MKKMFVACFLYLQSSLIFAQGMMGNVREKGNEINTELLLFGPIVFAAVGVFVAIKVMSSGGNVQIADYKGLLIGALTFSFITPAIEFFF